MAGGCGGLGGGGWVGEWIFGERIWGDALEGARDYVFRKLDGKLRMWMIEGSRWRLKCVNLQKSGGSIGA